MNKTVMVCAIMLFVLTGCKTIGVENTQLSTKSLFLATTTTTRDSGLLDYILDDFEQQSHIEVKVIVVGTGKALQLGRDGEVDVVLTHATELEQLFVEEGYADHRYDVMYNDFVLVGPLDDPLKLAELEDLSENDKVTQAFKRIYDAKTPFVSRGDNSGTYIKEQLIWSLCNLDPFAVDHYLSAGKGMGDVLTMTNEFQGYTLTDRGTFYKYKGDLALKILVEAPKLMKNQYGIMAVNHKDMDNQSTPEAKTFVDWILSEETQQLINTYGTDTYDQGLFKANAK